MHGTSLKNRTTIYIIIGVILIAANVFTYGREFGRDLKIVDHTASEQLLYHPSYAGEGYAPDAMVREIVRDRKVLVPRGVKPYSEYWSYTHMHDEWNPFSVDYFSPSSHTLICRTSTSCGRSLWTRILRRTSRIWAGDMS